MSKYVCRLCPRLIISESVTFAAGALTVDLPAGSYSAGERYCIVVAQTIPADTTIAAPVVITIGGGTVTYPLVNRNGAPISAASLRTRTKYAACVATTATGGSFKLLGNPACSPDYSLAAIDGTAPAVEGGAA